VILSVAELGFLEAATTREIVGTDHDTDQHGNLAPFTEGRGQQLGLELCRREVVLQFRLDYKDQPLDELLYVAMKHIASSDGEPRIFVLVHNADGLGLDAIQVRPDDKWHPNNKFMFCCTLK
ncbi:MAG: hypothetical protein MN733_15745, partial [Nitrososphaera sp.]|nr:hypothetical protein [Nitrososphaera sp.]